ncbi:hypothetical protein B0T22DRAFT_523572 [Podospora appendiculata]|uniref:DUF8021 domain-containing protein n=1 Tax=Podospora appendiculata TaxID=314037 RepID=A0AAE0WZ73_9PEZI|nr:hypothetical protein B0T22DRAFT_523572 [Podospora appendiculata]
MIPTFTLSLLALSGTALALPTTPSADGCTRAVLKAHTETYLAAQAAGNPSLLLAIASPNLTYYEDGALRDPKSKLSTLTTPLPVSHNRSILDTTQCATFTELISAPATTNNATHRVIGTQLRFDPSTLALVKVESLVTQQGDWAFNATQTLRYAAAEDGQWGEIAVAARDSRAVIQAAADAYLDLFNNASVVVPWGTPCHRLEGGWYTGNGSATDSCNVGVPSGVSITHRRYVIDEVLGVVDALVAFATRPDSHEFRVEGGKIRFVVSLWRELIT